MMDIYVDHNAPTLRLEKAVLLYEQQGYSNDKTAYASVHEVRFNGGGQAVVGPGEPATREGLLAALDALLGKLPCQFLPSNVLAASRKRLVWHVPASRRPLYFEGSTALAGLSGSVWPLPALVFAASGLPNDGSAKLSVYAVRRRGRPRPDTLLYHAPFFNVYKNGGVCLGSMRKPSTTGIAAAEAWTEAFFQSAFTHGTGHALLRGQPGYVQTMQTLAGCPDASFPTKRLIRTGRRLHDLIAAR